MPLNYDSDIGNPEIPAGTHGLYGGGNIIGELQVNLNGDGKERWRWSQGKAFVDEFKMKCNTTASFTVNTTWLYNDNTLRLGEQVSTPDGSEGQLYEIRYMDGQGTIVGYLFRNTQWPTDPNRLTWYVYPTHVSSGRIIFDENNNTKKILHFKRKTSGSVTANFRHLAENLIP